MAGGLRKRDDALDHRMSARLRKLHQLGVIDADAVQRLRAAFAAGKTIRFEIDLAGRYGGERVGFRGQRGGEHFHCCRSEDHTSELQSLMRISYDVFCFKKKKCKT